ncbi:MAG: cytochrome c [Methylococcales bacterium]|jgi:hypothetical protein|nr:cytochrome c [Methylococcales bacterium]MBT7409425.1 cytochrome c [Methylococcales bacterium]
MNKKCIIVILPLILIIIGGLYKFIFQGNVSNSHDGRITIHLNIEERDLVLTEMRGFLIAIQQITTAVTTDNLKQAAQSARKVGAMTQATVPGTLVGKLPLAFKKLGFDTHKKFDLLALNAEDFGEKDQVLKQLSTLMQNCVSCHETYRFDVSK